jgi:hypothetical protein
MYRLNFILSTSVPQLGDLPFLMSTLMERNSSHGCTYPLPNLRHLTFLVVGGLLVVEVLKQGAV